MISDYFRFGLSPLLFFLAGKNFFRERKIWILQNRLSNLKVSLEQK